MKIWTEKHKPSQLDGIVGQKKAIDEALPILSQPKTGSKGKAALLTGPAGCGKTLLVETIARQEGLQLMQLNASDKRNLDSIEQFTQTTNTRALFSKGKIILLDEVDGISGRDRGAVGAIVSLIKQSSFPVFLIANDPWLSKLRPLRPYVKMIKFHKVPVPSVAKRLREICEAEGIRTDPDTMKHLARWSQGDLRSAINDLQMVAQGKAELTAKDLEVLGFRERGSTVFDILPTVFKSRNIQASRKAIWSADKDSDEIFWWLESNMHQEFKNPTQLAAAYDTLAKADFFRSLVIKQQNWSFKGYMVDMMAGLSLAKDIGAESGGGSDQAHRHHSHGFTPYQPPKRMIDMARSRKQRADRAEAYAKLGSHLHASRRKVAREYAPYLRILLKKNKGLAASLGLEKDEIKAIK
jgi:replication factor C large subunit